MTLHRHSRVDYGGQIPPFVERLETAGLVSLVVYDDEGNAVRVSLWPDGADALAAELGAAAKDVRDA